MDSDFTPTKIMAECRKVRQDNEQVVTRILGELQSPGLTSCGLHLSVSPMDANFLGAEMRERGFFVSGSTIDSRKSKITLAAPTPEILQLTHPRPDKWFDGHLSATNTNPNWSSLDVFQRLFAPWWDKKIRDDLKKEIRESQCNAKSPAVRSELRLSYFVNACLAASGDLLTSSFTTESCLHEAVMRTIQQLTVRYRELGWNVELEHAGEKSSPVFCLVFSIPSFRDETHKQIQ